MITNTPPQRFTGWLSQPLAVALGAKAHFCLRYSLQRIIYTSRSVSRQEMHPGIQAEVL